ncbi:MAG: hypothetical protein MUP47_04695 [Phycisphaerae bacterium]|nr:hypothetical protein [Phycisphaerae bacterium]
MLEKLDKIAPFLVLALLGYLCHSVMPSEAVSKAQGKDDPPISEQMLHPELLTPEPYASPVNRDPFDVRWASYREGSTTPGAPSETAPPEESPTSGPSGEVWDPEAAPPPLPTGLKGLLLADDVQFVVVGDKICKPGDLVSGNDPRRSWVVERVEVDGVVLRFGDVRRKVELIKTDKTEATPTSAPSEDENP